MKIVSINYLAAVGALALLTPSTDAQQNLRPSHAQQRLRALTDEEVISAAVSMSARMSMSNLDGGGWWGVDSSPEASKSAKTKSAKSEWEGVGDWSKSAKSDSAKSAKSEWEGVGEWSKSAKSDSSAKSAKSEWEGIGEWSKSAKSDSAKSAKSQWEGVGDWSKSSKSVDAKSAKSLGSAKSAKAIMAPTVTEEIQAIIESIVSGESTLSTEDAVDVAIAEMSSLCYDGFIEAPSPEDDPIVTPTTSIIEQVIDVMSSTFGINKDEVQAALSSIDIPLEPTIADISDGSTLTEDEFAALQSWVPDTEDAQAVPIMNDGALEVVVGELSSALDISEDEIQAALLDIMSQTPSMTNQEVDLDAIIHNLSITLGVTKGEVTDVLSSIEIPQEEGALEPPTIAEIAEASTLNENELGALQSWFPDMDEVAAEVSSISPDGIDMMQSPSMTAGDLELLVGELSSVFGISEEEVQAALLNVMSLTAGMSSQEVDLDSAIDQMSSMSGISKAEAEAAVEGIMSQVPSTQEAAALVESANLGVDPAIAQMAQGEVEAVLAPIEAEIPKITTEEAAALYGSVNSNSQEVGALVSSLSVEKVIHDLVHALQAGQVNVAQAMALLELQLPSMASQLKAQGIVLSEYAPAVVVEDP